MISMVCITLRVDKGHKNVIWPFQDKPEHPQVVEPCFERADVHLVQDLAPLWVMLRVSVTGSATCGLSAGTSHLSDIDQNNPLPSTEQYLHLGPGFQIHSFIFCEKGIAVKKSKTFCLSITWYVLIIQALFLTKLEEIQTDVLVT